MTEQSRQAGLRFAGPVATCSASCKDRAYLIRFAPPLSGRLCAVAEGVVSIAESYRGMTKDIQREAEGTKDNAVRAAYIALADPWLARAIQLDQSASNILHNSLALARRVAA